MGLVDISFPNVVKTRGCLNPILFNLYINDFISHFKEGSTDPVMIMDSLLYADDILLSSSDKGLQNSLDTLYLETGSQ